MSHKSMYCQNPLVAFSGRSEMDLVGILPVLFWMEKGWASQTVSSRFQGWQISSIQVFFSFTFTEFFWLCEYLTSLKTFARKTIFNLIFYSQTSHKAFNLKKKAFNLLSTQYPSKKESIPLFVCSFVFFSFEKPVRFTLSIQVGSSHSDLTFCWR